jgi:hypothetical protein
MFLLDRKNAYTPVPGLLHEYERIGADATHRELGRIKDSVLLARRTVREALGMTEAYGQPQTLEGVAAALGIAFARGRLQVDDPLAADLIAELVPAIQLVQGDAAAADALRPAGLRGGGEGRLLTLTGAAGLR